MPLKPVKNHKQNKSGFVMFSVGSNDVLNPNLMEMGLLVASENMDEQIDIQQTDRQTDKIHVL